MTKLCIPFPVKMGCTRPGNPSASQQRVFGDGGDSKAPNATRGQSFYSTDGTTWNDLAVVYGAENSTVANIRAFESPPSITLTATASPTTVTVKQNFTIN